MGQNIINNTCQVKPSVELNLKVPNLNLENKPIISCDSMTDEKNKNISNEKKEENKKNEKINLTNEFSFENNIGENKLSQISCINTDKDKNKIEENYENKMKKQNDENLLIQKKSKLNLELNLNKSNFINIQNSEKKNYQISESKIFYLKTKFKNQIKLKTQICQI